MNRVDELCTDLGLLIAEHKMLEVVIAENRKLKESIEYIKAEIRQKQWHIGVDSANQVIEIIDKHTKGDTDAENSF